MNVLRSVDRFKNSTHMELRVSGMVIGRIPKTKDWSTLSMLSLKRSVPEVGGWKCNYCGHITKCLTPHDAPIRRTPE